MSSLGISGISSGLDIDQLVTDLMKVEQVKADQLFQKREIITWQKEQYRSIINEVRSFKDELLNIANPGTNLMSYATFTNKSAVCSSSLVSVSASSDAMIGDSSFTVIQSATAAKAVAASICLESSSGVRLNLTDTMETVSSKLGEALVFDGEGNFTLTLNETSFTINKNDTFGSIIDNINSSSAQLQVYYSNFSDTLTFTSQTTGAGSITTDDGGGFFSALGLTVSEGSVGEAGRDAIFEINGVEGERSSNAFTIDGISYQINTQIDSPVETMTISIQTNVDAIYNTIEKFVNNYNSMLDVVNGKLDEERFSDFAPLTDEQKTEMSENEIELWQGKAQSGLLRNDSYLENMLRSMRQSIYDMTGIYHVSEIGIETSSSYSDKGKLVLINQGETLREAIAANPNKVADIFARSSDISYSPDSSSAEKTQRYNESGIAHRISDIINDNIRTTRDSYGFKGKLLEKAGIEGDVTEFNNILDRQILDINERMEQTELLLAQKETRYYNQFTAMEKALQQMYSQSDWLTAQLNQLSS